MASDEIVRSRGAEEVRTDSQVGSEGVESSKTPQGKKSRIPTPTTQKSAPNLRRPGFAGIGNKVKDSIGFLNKRQGRTLRSEETSDLVRGGDPRELPRFQEVAKSVVRPSQDVQGRAAEVLSTSKTRPGDDTISLEARETQTSSINTADQAAHGGSLAHAYYHPERSGVDFALHQRTLNQSRPARSRFGAEAGPSLTKVSSRPDLRGSAQVDSTDFYRSGPRRDPRDLASEPVLVPILPSARATALAAGRSQTNLTSTAFEESPRERLRRAEQAMRAGFRDMGEGYRQFQRGWHMARNAVEEILDVAYDAHGGRS